LVVPYDLLRDPAFEDLCALRPLCHSRTRPAGRRVPRQGGWSV